MSIQTRLGFLALIAGAVSILWGSAVFLHAGSPRTSFAKFYIPVLAQSIDSYTQPPVILTDEQAQYTLGRYLEIFEDPSSELTIEDVSSPAYDSHFVPSEEEIPVYGYTDSAYWVRLRLDNDTSQTENWLLDVGFPNMHLVDLYSPSPDGRGFEVKQSGNLRPVTNRDVLYPDIVFKMDIPTGSRHEYYLRFQSGASMTLGLTLWTNDAFIVHAQWENMLRWLFFGSILALLIYHLFLLVSLRETVYLYFVLLLASVLVMVFNYDGYLAIVFPGLYAIHPNLQAVFFSLVILSIILFSDAFTELGTRHPNLHQGTRLLAASWAILAFLSFFLSYHILAKFGTLWALVSLAFVVFSGVFVWRKGLHPMLFFLIAWLGLAASLFLNLLVRLSIIPSTYFNENGYHLAMLAMAVFWSIALADRINLLKAQSESANYALRSSETKLSQILEGLPLAVVVYGKDRRPTYGNKRAYDILSNRSRGIQPDLSAGRTLEMAIDYFSLHKEGTDQVYPVEDFPIHSALQGVSASADDIEAHLGDRRVPLEVWASPVRDDAGNIEAAIVAFQDITERKQSEAELTDYRRHLEALVGKRTVELNALNERLQLHVNWLSAINQFNQLMASAADFRQIYQKVLEIINQLFSVPGSFITEIAPLEEHLEILAYSSSDGLDSSVKTLPAHILLRSKLEQGGITFVQGDQLRSLDGAFGRHIRDSKVNSIGILPLQLREQVFGYLGLELAEEGRVMTAEEASLLNIFSTDIAQLIHDSLLYEQSRQLIMAEERNRLARELHDSVTQTLFAVSVLAETTPHLWEKDQEIARQNMAKLRRLIRGALAEMRSLLIELRLGDLHNQTLDQLLSTLVDGARARSQAVFSLSLAEELPELPAEITLAFYRIAGEALNNAIVHSDASQIDVCLSFENGLLELRIKDNGSGFDHEHVSKGHLGLKIMFERSQAIHSNLQIHTAPGQGTEIRAAWPDQAEKAKGNG